MRRLFVLGALLLGALALVIGCSDDEGTPTGGLNQGDTANLSFQFIDSAVGGDIFSSMEYSVGIAFSLMEGLPAAGPRFSRDNPIASLAVNPDQEIILINVIFEYNDPGWFIFQFEALIVDPLENDTTEVNGTDSLQFLNNGVPIDTSGLVQEIDELKIRGHAQWSHSDDASGATHHRLDIEIQESGADTLILIDAAANDTLGLLWSTDSASCALDMFNSLTVTDILIDPNVEETCPVSGRLALSSTVDLSCEGGSQNPFDQLDINHTWTIVAVMNDDETITVTYSDGTTLWTVTRSCYDL